MLYMYLKFHINPPYILSNKRNAPNRKLNHKLRSTVKVLLNKDVRYEYDKTFESTIKLRDY